jgi:hypothetical protein
MTNTAPRTRRHLRCVLFGHHQERDHHPDCTNKESSRHLYNGRFSFCARPGTYLWGHVGDQAVHRPTAEWLPPRLLPCTRCGAGGQP